MMDQPNSLNDLIKQHVQEEEQQVAAVEAVQETQANEQPEKVIVGGEGQTQLPLEALKQDQTTPGSSMSNLQNFVENDMDAKIEEAKKEREQWEAEQAKLKEQEALENKEEELKEQFQDEIIEEKTEQEVADEMIPDLTSIKVMKPKNLDETFNNIILKEKEEAVKTKVLLPISGYSASLIGMSSPEIRNFSNTLNNLDSFGYLDAKYKNVYRRITETSVGEMSYETFLKRTALMEYEILAYGLFSSSFPDENKYPFECPNCKARDTFVFNNKQFMQLPDDREHPEKRKAIEDALLGVIKAEATNAQDFFEHADTNTLVRKYLKHSRIIVELRHPTLFDQLNDVVRNVSDELIEEAEEIVNLMPFIYRVYYPTPETIHDEVPTYIELDDVNKKVRALMKLNDEDDDKLAEEINNEILSKYKVKYALKAPKCRICGHDVPAQGVIFDQMLFMMRQIRITKR